MTKKPTLKLVHVAAGQAPCRSASEVFAPKGPPKLAETGQLLLDKMLDDGVIEGDSLAVLPALPRESVDLFFTSPPYADARAYSRIHPDRYVEWFLPFARAMYDAAKPSGSLIINIKNRVANRGPLKGQRHPYVYQLVLALQNMGWRWVETYIWSKPNAVPGKFGPRTKDSFEYVYHFARGNKPFFDLNAVRVPYKADASEIERRKKDKLGRRSTEAGTAAMPEGLAEFFIKAASPAGGVVVDPFAGGATTVVVGRRLGRQAGGIELHEDFVKEGLRRIAADLADDTPGQLVNAMGV
jgi:DNA modification methylase